MWSSRLPRLLLRGAQQQLASTAAARRTFLSDAYRCQSAWDARLQTAILQRCRPESFYYELDGRFTQAGKCSAIDIDIFANSLTDGGYADEVADLLYKLRHTEETTATLASTGHALCRLHLEHVPDVHELLAILDDRLNYGVFLDGYTANLALDGLLKRREFVAAARVATFMMLQEELDGEITRALALYACYKWTREPVQTFERPSAEETSADPALAAGGNGGEASAKPAGPAAKKKKAEEVRVRVDFIRNPFHDDHFDLREAAPLVGKTLAMIGRSLERSGERQLGASAQLLGLWYHGKVAEAAKLVERLLRSDGPAVHADAVTAVVAAVEASAGEASAEVQALGEQLRKLAGDSAKLVAGDLEQQISALAQAAVAQNEQTEIEAQTKVYADWCTERQAALEAEAERLQRVQRLAEIERRTADMEREEQRLWFFENEDAIDLQIDGKKVTYPKRWFGKKKKPRVVDAGYVPPEIVRTLPSVQ